MFKETILVSVIEISRNIDLPPQIEIAVSHHNGIPHVVPNLKN